MKMKTHTLLALFFVSALVFVLGNWIIPLSDPDEVFYALTAHEMIAHKSYLTPLVFGVPQFEKPPFYYWLLMLVFKIFGEGAFVARFVGAAIAFSAVVATYFFVRKIHTERAALFSALILGSSIWWLGVAKSVLTDIVFSAFIGFAFYSFYLWFDSKNKTSLYWFGLWVGLATLSKGPLGLAFPLLGCLAFLLLEKKRDRIFQFLISRWWFLFAVVALPWYAYTFINYGKDFWQEFFVHDHWHRFLYAEHKNFDRWYFYPLVLILGLFPWTIALPFVGCGWKRNKILNMFLLSWIFVVFVICQLAHSKLASYTSPLYMGLVILIGVALDSALTSSSHLRFKIAGTIAGVLACAFTIAPFFAANELPRFKPLIITECIILAVIFLIASWSMLRGRIAQSSYTLAAVLPLFFGIGIFLLPADIGDGFTDGGLPKIIRGEGYDANIIVASKLYARGVNYHSGKGVVVLAGNEQPFWSPHPVQVLHEDEEIMQFYLKHSRLLSVLSEKDYKRVQAVLGDKIEYKTLTYKFGRVVALTIVKTPAVTL